MQEALRDNDDRPDTIQSSKVVFALSEEWIEKPNHVRTREDERGWRQNVEGGEKCLKMEGTGDCRDFTSHA